MEEKKEINFEKVQKRSLKFWIVISILLVLTILIFFILPLWMASILLLVVLLPVIIYLLIYRWINKKFASFIFAFSVWLNILILIIPIFGGVLALDLMDFSKDFSHDPKYIILNDGGLFFGVRIKSLDFSKNPDYKVLSKQDILDIQNDIGQKGRIVFIVNKEVFRNVNNIQIEEAGISLSKDEVFEILKSDDPIDLLAKKSPVALSGSFIKDQIKQKLGSEDQVKAFAFLKLMETTIEREGPKYFLEEIQNGNIKIYPERTSLKILIKLVPIDLLGNFLPEIPGV